MFSGCPSEPLISEGSSCAPRRVSWRQKIFLRVASPMNKPHASMQHPGVYPTPPLPALCQYGAQKLRVPTNHLLNAHTQTRPTHHQHTDLLITNTPTYSSLTCCPTHHQHTYLVITNTLTYSSQTYLPSHHQHADLLITNTITHSPPKLWPTRHQHTDPLITKSPACFLLLLRAITPAQYNTWRFSSCTGIQSL